MSAKPWLGRSGRRPPTWVLLTTDIVDDAMRILHLVSTTEQLATRRSVRDVAGAIGDLGHESKVIELSREAPRSGDDEGVEVAKVSGLSAQRALRQRMGTFDLTIAHGPIAGEVSARLAGQDVPFVYRQVRDTRFWPRRPLRPKRTPSYFAKATAVVALSAGARLDLVEMMDLSQSNVFVIPIGVSSAALRVPTTAERAKERTRIGIEQDDFVVMTVGVLTYEKGVHIAVRACLDLPEARLFIVGAGPEQERLERLADGLASPGQVVFGGAASDRGLTYGVADVVCHPSITGESMPVGAIEAGFCGVPVVASALGSTDSVVLDEKTGLVVPAGDVDELREGLEKLGAAVKMRVAMGEAARRHCLDRFEIEVVAKEWVELFTEVV